MKRKKIARLVLLVLSPALLFGLYVLAQIIYGTVTDYRPSEIIELNAPDKNAFAFDTTISLLNWNIGYCGLGAESDFFYDGGKMVRSPKEWIYKNLKGVTSICSDSSYDFILLQEADIKSSRSYYTNQQDSLNKHLPDYSSTFALNYNCRFVPIPFTQPMGKTYSGLITYEKTKGAGHTRYQFPGKFPYPKRIYFLDRCMLVSRYHLRSGKDLLIINAHFSAYDDTGELKKQEMDYFRKFVMDEYEKGNYIICGADWNQCPPGFNTSTFKKEGNREPYEKNIDTEFMPAGWQWAYDPTMPTNRDNAAPYNTQKTFTTIIDFFLLSPNVEPKDVKTIETNFKWSDHQPVQLRLRLK